MRKHIEWECDRTYPQWHLQRKQEAVPFPNQPVRAEGLGRRRCFQRLKSQAVRPAGKRLRRRKSAEVFVGDCHAVTGGLALGIEAEMIFGGNACRGQSEVPLNAIAFRGMAMRIKPKIIVAESPTARRREMMTDNGS